MIIIVITDALHWFIFLFFFLLLIVHFLDLFSFSLLVATFLNFFFQLITCLGFFSFFSFFLGTDQSDDTICTKQDSSYTVIRCLWLINVPETLPEVCSAYQACVQLYHYLYIVLTCVCQGLLGKPQLPLQTPAPGHCKLRLEPFAVHSQL